MTLKNTNSIMRSVVETDLDKLELSMKDEHIDTLFTLIVSFYQRSEIQKSSIKIRIYYKYKLYRICITHTLNTLNTIHI